MSLSIKLRHFLGIDQWRDYWWLNSTEYNESWVEDREVKETCKLQRKSKCNLLLEENVCISIDSEFEGIVIGKKESTVRINNQFSGLISCDLLICGPNAKIAGDLLINKLIISEGIMFEVTATMGKLIYDSIPLSLSDIRGLSPLEFMKKYYIH